MFAATIPIEIEGVDKSGKDTLAPYLTIINNYKYSVNVRGTLTQLVYNDKFNRNVDYVITYKPLIVFLDVDDNDFNIRCKISNEPKINIQKDREAYKAYIEVLRQVGITVLEFNSSEFTPYMIAKTVRDVIETQTTINDFTLPNKPIIKPLGIYQADDLKGEDIFYEYKEVGCNESSD